MHPEIAKALVTQHRDELVRHTMSDRHTMSNRYATSGRYPTSVPRAGRRWFPRWRISWTRTVLAQADGVGSADASRAGQAGRRGSSLVIIISAYRSA